MIVASFTQQTLPPLDDRLNAVQPAISHPIHSSLYRCIAVFCGSESRACACREGPATYPISGEQCGPDDPVKTLDAQNCLVV